MKEVESLALAPIGAEESPEMVLAKTVAALQGGSPTLAVAVVVPSQMAASVLRQRLITCLGTLCNVEFLTPLNFANLILKFSIEFAQRNVVSDLQLQSIVRHAFHTRAQDPKARRLEVDLDANEELFLALAQAIFELRSVTQRDLERLVPTDPKARLALEVQKRFGAELALHGLVLEIDSFERASSLLGSEKARSIASLLGPVILYAPHNLPRASQEMFSMMANLGNLSVIELESGVPDTDSRFRATLGRGPVFEGVSAHRLSTTAIATKWPDVELVIAPDRTNEIEIAISEILAGLSSGLACDEISLLVSSESEYLDDLLWAAKNALIPINSPRVLPRLRNRETDALWRLITFCRSGLRSDLVELMTLCEMKYSRLGIWSSGVEELTVVNELTGDLFKWAAMLLEDTVAPSQDRAGGPILGPAIHLNELAKFLVSLRGASEAFEIALVANSWSGLAFSIWILFSHISKKLPLLFSEAARGESESESTFGNQMVDALRKLGQLDSLEDSPSEIGLKMALDSLTKSGEAVFSRDPRGVRVAGIESFLPAKVKKLILVGMTEDLYPRFSTTGLLSESFRSVAGLLTARDRLAIAERSFFAQIRFASSVVITIARSAVGAAEELFPSPLIGMLEALIVKQGDQLRRRVVASRSKFALEVGVPNDLAMVNTLNVDNCGDRLQLDLFHLDEFEQLQTTTKDVYQRNLSIEKRLRDSVVLLGDSLTSGIVLSPTKIERYLGCPADFFAVQILRIRNLDDPETKMDLDPLSRGSLVHSIFEKIVASKMESDEKRESFDPTDFAEEIDQCFAPVLRFAERGSVARRFWVQRALLRIRREVGTFLQQDQSHQANCNAHPVAVEKVVKAQLEFDDPFGTKLALPLSGKLDRIDRSSDRLIIIDYKTGSSDGYGKTTKVDPHKVQLGLYAQMISQNPPDFCRSDPLVLEGLYWFVSERNGYKLVPVDAGALLDQEQSANLAVALIHRGIFASGLHSISQHNSCDFCDPFGSADTSQHRDLLGFMGLSWLDDAVGISVDPEFWRDYLERLGGSKQ